MKQVKLHFVGSTDLLMHNPSILMNPFHKITQEMKGLTAKRKKSDEDLRRISELEWHASLYFDPEVGVYMPGDNVEKCAVECARMKKRGKDVQRGLMCLERRIPLIVDGKVQKNISALFSMNGKYVDLRPERVSGRGVLRTRPIFRDWQFTVDIAFDDEIWNERDVVQLFEDAGKYMGLCDRRPRFGQFVVEKA